MSADCAAIKSFTYTYVLLLTEVANTDTACRWLNEVEPLDVDARDEWHSCVSRRQIVGPFVC